MVTETDLGRRTGPILSDGTPLADLIDTDKREVSMRVLSDPEIYRLELERLFGRSWVPVAHESEIPRPGDFVSRSVAEDPVIVTRTRGGEVKVLLNICQHRGMQVCRVDAGNASQFRCVYHGWVYGQDGRFLGAPVKKEQMWGDVRDKAELGLPQARVEVFGGMVFATFDQTAPSLDDWFGDYKWYLNLMYDRTESGLEALGPPQRFTIKANWKCAGEQFNADGYHTLTLHRSLFELGVIGTETTGEAIAEMAPAMYGVDVSVPQGHSLRCIPAETTFSMLMGRDVSGMSVMERLRTLPPPGLTPGLVDTLPRRFGKEEMRILAECAPQVGGLFPNSGLVSIWQPSSDGTMGSTMTWHTFVPKGPEEFEFVNWVLVERDASDEVKEKMLQASVRSVGSSGTVEQDDAEVWPSMHRSSRGAMGRRQTLKYQALLGVNKPDDWPGSGQVYDGFSKDDGQWNWWLRWAEFMTGTPS
jgi:nitrite reductase/ring-hydroxylating ferredoxin subunit